MGGRVDIRGIESIIQNMRNIHPNVRQHLRDAAEQAGQHLQKKALEKASLTCHDLEDLADLDHPYSTRYPQDSFEHPDEMVHFQSGKLFENIERVVNVDDGKVVVAVGVDEGKVPYIGYLIDGTSKMRSRDFLGHTLKEEKEKTVRIIKYGLVEGLGSRGGRR